MMYGQPAPLSGFGDLACAKCDCPTCPGESSGLGAFDPITAGLNLFGAVLGGGMSIYAAKQQAEALAKQQKIMRQQQKFEQAQTLQQAEQVRQQAAFQASKEMRWQEIVALSLVGLTAVGVSWWLFKKSREK